MPVEVCLPCVLALWVKMAAAGLRPLLLPSTFPLARENFLVIIVGEGTPQPSQILTGPEASLCLSV